MASDTDSDHNEDTGPRRIGLVVVGDGDSIRTYVDALRSMDRARIVGVVNRSGRGPTVDGGDLQWAADVPNTLGWAGVEAYVVAESTSVDTDVEAAITETRKPAFFGLHASRHREDVRTVRELIGAGDLGDVVFARFTDMLDLERVGSGPGWPSHSNQHRLRMIDVIAFWIQDEPRSVFAQQSSKDGDYECVTIRFEGGATAVCEFGSSVGRHYREVFVVGTSATARMSWTDHTNLILPARKAAFQIVDSHDRLDVILDSWLEDLTVESRSESDEDFDGIAHTLAIAEAVKRSTDSGEAADVRPTEDRHV